jgi:FkbM family methyltransferase
MDLGANIGDSVRFFLEAYPTARILAVEPDAGNLQICHQNVEVMGALDRVLFLRCFVGATAGSAGIDRSGGEWAYRMAAPLAGAEVMPVRTVDEMLREMGVEQLDLLKCDIEGSEQDLFGHCSPWISRIRNIVIETNPPYGIALLERDLEANGGQFRKVWHSAPDGYHELALFSQR